MTRQEFAADIARILKPCAQKPYLEETYPQVYDDIKEAYTKCVAAALIKDDHFQNIIAPGNYKKIPSLGEGNQARVPTDGCCG